MQKIPHRICLSNRYFINPIMCTWTVDSVLRQGLVDQNSLDAIIARLAPLPTRNVATTTTTAVVRAPTTAKPAVRSTPTTEPRTTTAGRWFGNLVGMIQAAEAEVVEEDDSEESEEEELGNGEEESGDEESGDEESQVGGVEEEETAVEEPEAAQGAAEREEEVVPVTEEDVKPLPEKKPPPPFYRPILPISKDGWAILHELPPPPPDKLLAQPELSADEDGDQEGDGEERRNTTSNSGRVLTSGGKAINLLGRRRG